MEVVWLSALAFVAGLVDSVVGGGGLIQVPALLVLLPPELSSHVALVLGTNKAASIWGTGMAVARYAPRVRIPWHSILPAAIAAFASAFAGAAAVSMLSSIELQPAILVLLVGVAAYTLLRPDLGRLHAPAFTAHKERTVGIVVGAVLGFYDGFFGPGMGSFLIFTFVGLFGFDFLSASASAKVINFATNLAALTLFVSTGAVLYHYAVPMAVCQMGGSIVVTRVAMTRGNGFVRALFLVVSGALILRFAWQVLAGR